MYNWRPWLPFAIVSIATCDLAFVLLGVAYGAPLIGHSLPFQTISIGGSSYNTASLAAGLLAGMLPLLVNCSIAEIRYRWRDRDLLRCAMVVAITISGVCLFIYLAHWWVSQALVRRAGELTILGLAVEWHLTAMLTLICLAGPHGYLGTIRAEGHDGRECAGRALPAFEPPPAQHLDISSVTGPSPQAAPSRLRPRRLFRVAGQFVRRPQPRPVSNTQPSAPAQSGSASDCQPVPTGVNDVHTQPPPLARVLRHRPARKSAPSAASAQVGILLRFLVGGAGIRGPPPPASSQMQFSSTRSGAIYGVRCFGRHRRSASNQQWGRNFRHSRAGRPA